MSLTGTKLVERPEFLPEFDSWQSISGKRIAITGASGTLGRILCSRLGNRGIGYSAFQGDITEPGQVNAWISDSNPELFFHFAAMVPVHDVLANPSKAMKTNALSMLYIIDSLKKFAQGCWLFYASSSHVYQDVQSDGTAQAINEDSPTGPTSLYGATKIAGESICRPLADCYQIPLCIGRIFSFFHDSQPEPYLIPSLYRRIREAADESTLEIQNTEAIRDFLDAEMVVDAILWLSAVRAEGIVNIASGSGISVGEIAKRIARNEDKNINFVGLNNSGKSALVANINRLSKLIKSAHE